MLDQMRGAAKSWVAKLFLGLLGVSFLVWGVPSSFLPQIGGGKIFSSGDSSVSPGDYSFALRDIVVRRNIERIPTARELRELGIAAAILSQLQFNLLLDEEARRMWLGADEDAALQLLRQDSFFHNIIGAFDRSRFLDFLSRGRFTQAEVIGNLRAQARRHQLLETVSGDLLMPDVFYQATVLYERESRSIDYVRVDSRHIGDLEPPTDEVLSAWFANNRKEFYAPEYRTFSYMELNAEMLADQQTITPEQLQQAYEENKQRFAVPERRKFAQLRFENRAAADAAYAKLQAGTSFEELVREQGHELEEIGRGPLAYGELPSLMATEIFALAQGQVSDVINDLAGGAVIVRIDKIEPAQIPPSLAEIAETLRHDMALAQANNAMRQTMREIENARFEGATLKELAEQYKLKLETRTVNIDGVVQNAEEQNESLPLRDTLLAQVFASQPGIDRDPLLGQDNYVWYQVEEIIPARALDFDEVYEAARNSWISEEIKRRLTEKAQHLKAALESGQSLAQIAQDNGLVVERKVGLQRVANIPFSTELGEDVIDAVFAVPMGERARAVNFIFPENERDVALVFQVTDSAEPLSTDPQSLPEQQRQAISARLSQDFIDQFINQALRDHAIEQNQALLNELLNDNAVWSLR